MIGGIVDNGGKFELVVNIFAHFSRRKKWTGDNGTIGAWDKMIHGRNWSGNLWHCPFVFKIFQKWNVAKIVGKIVTVIYRSDTTLIKKKKTFFSYIRKFRMEPLQSHIWGRASLYMRKCANI
jgi:hypothetical protein